MHKTNKENIIKIVQQRLWSRGYKVKSFDVEDIGFDLVVNGEYKIKVERSYNVDVKKPIEDDLIIALVISTKADNYIIEWFSRDGLFVSPVDVLGLPKKNEIKKQKNKIAEESH